MKKLNRLVLVGLLALNLGLGFRTFANGNSPKIEAVDGLCDEAKKKVGSSCDKETSAEGTTYRLANGSTIFLSNEVKEKMAAIDVTKYSLFISNFDEVKDYVVEFDEKTNLPVLKPKD